MDDKDEIKKLIEYGDAGAVSGIIRRNVTYDDFIKTFTATEEQYQKAFQLWGEEKWDELYDFFVKNKLNMYDGKPWPPFNGAISITKREKGKNLVNKMFDRFQGAGDISGEYASPVYGSEGVDELFFTFDSRALGSEIKEGTNYVKFKFKSDVPDDLVFEYGDVIPWFGKTGLGDQVKSSMKFKDLLDAGYIEIIEQLEYKGNKIWETIK